MTPDKLLIDPMSINLPSFPVDARTAAEKAPMIPSPVPLTSTRIISFAFAIL